MSFLLSCLLLWCIVYTVTLTIVIVLGSKTTTIVASFVAVVVMIINNNTITVPCSIVTDAQSMLCAGDPFTRLLRPGRQATAFQNTTEGQIVALGLQLANAPDNQLQVGLTSAYLLLAAST